MGVGPLSRELRRGAAKGRHAFPEPAEGMSDMTNGHDERLPFQRLDAYVTAKEIARLVHAAKIEDPELRDQATRAAKSTFLALCEGLPNRGVAMRRKYFVTADNSLHETLGAMDLAATIGAARGEDAAAVQALGGKLRQMIRGLLR